MKDETMGTVTERDCPIIVFPVLVRLLPRDEGDMADSVLWKGVQSRVVVHPDSVIHLCGEVA